MRTSLRFAREVDGRFFYSRQSRKWPTWIPSARAIWASDEPRGQPAARKPDRSVFPEDALQFLAVLGTCQRHGRKNARFLRIEVMGNDPIVLVVWLFGVADHEPAAVHVG